MDQKKNNLKLIKNQDPINSFIFAHEVLIIDDNGEKLGIFKKNEAIHLAKEKGLDLMQVGKQPDGIAICKVLDYGKFKYQQQKKNKKNKKNQVKVENREIRLTVNIGKNDMMTKVKKAREFLIASDRVKISLKFKGREITYINLGKETINRFYKEIEDVARIEKDVKLNSRFLDMYVIPRIPRK